MLQSAPGRAAMQARAIAAIDAAAADLRRVSAQIHDRPELNFEERHAHDVLTTAAAAAGLTVQRGAFDLPTAFSASAGAGGHRVAICCEYDALPEIGHACGHNLIAAAGLGAGIGAAAGLATAGATGRVVVLGTPAEEGGGGKIEMIARGAFEDVDAALMAHPAPSDLLRPGVSALQQMDVVYRGRNAHAAGAPWEGRNALDAMVIAYSAISALRQQLPPGALVHGVITHGGDKPNIIPSLTRAEFIVRARDRGALARLKERVLACFRAGAEASGCTVEVQQRGHEYLDMRHNAPIVEAYAANLRDVGRAAARGRRRLQRLQHRHGQRQLRDAIDPSRLRHPRRGRQSHARVHGGRGRRARPGRDARRRQGDGADRPRPAQRPRTARERPRRLRGRLRRREGRRAMSPAAPPLPDQMPDQMVDHIVYAAPDLDAAVADLEARLGVRASYGGYHPGAGSHNALMDLGGGAYLEIIAPDPGQPDPAGRRRPFGLDDLTEPKLAGWAAKATDLDTRVALARLGGFDPGLARTMRRERPDGVELVWTLTSAGPALGGLVPFLIDWGEAPHPAATAPGGCRLTALSGRHPRPAEVEAALAALDLALPVEEGAVALLATLDTPNGVVRLT